MFLFRVLRKIHLQSLREAFLLDQCSHCGTSNAPTQQHVRIAPQSRVEDVATTILPAITLPHIETHRDEEDIGKTRKMYKVWRRTNGGRAAEKHIVFSDGSRFVCEP